MTGLRRLATAPLLALVLAGGPAPGQSPEQSLGALAQQALRIGDTNGIIVQQDGVIVAEAYAGRMHAERATNIKSAAKSILGLLVGIAIREGYLDGVDQPIGGFFPEFFAEHPEPSREAITIGDLLSMRAGMASTSRRNYGAWVVSESWVEYVLRQPLVAEPGEKRIYSTGNTHLLSVILTRATGMSTREFAERYLFGPMDIGIGGWDRDPEGYYFGGNNLALSPRSLLKLGELVLNQGRYRGEQLVPAQWVETSLGRYTRSRYNPYYYGYLWWQHRPGGYDTHFAWGNGGQFIIVVPALRAVLAVTAASDVPGGAGSRGGRERFFRLLGERLFPALQARLSAESATSRARRRLTASHHWPLRNPHWRGVERPLRPRSVQILWRRPFLDGVFPYGQQSSRGSVGLAPGRNPADVADLRHADAVRPEERPVVAEVPVDPETALARIGDGYSLAPIAGSPRVRRVCGP